MHSAYSTASFSSTSTSSTISLHLKHLNVYKVSTPTIFTISMDFFHGWFVYITYFFVVIGFFYQLLRFVSGEVNSTFELADYHSCEQVTHIFSMLPVPFSHKVSWILPVELDIRIYCFFSTGLPVCSVLSTWTTAGFTVTLLYSGLTISPGPT